MDAALLRTGLAACLLSWNALGQFAPLPGQAHAVQAATAAAGSLTPAGPAYPLMVSPGQHYVVDQNGSPFFIFGDAPWYIVQSLQQADVDYYLSNKWVQGYNTIEFAPNENSRMDAYGNLEWTNAAGGYTNLASINPNFWTNVDYVISRAGYYGICCFVFPLYDGYGGLEPDGMYADMVAAGSNTLYSYGRFIGSRYKAFTNIVWVGAGDYEEVGAPNYVWNAVAAGIQSVDANHIFTALPARPSMGYYYSNFVTLNSTYASQYSYEQSAANYQLSPVRPSFLIEGYYENRPNISGFPAVLTAQNCRQFAYWSVFSGDMGCLYGDDNFLAFPAGWQQEMWDAGATTMTNLPRLMLTRAWTNCVPDLGHTTVTSGYGSVGSIDYITCTREGSGKTVLVYIPQDHLTFTVAMAQISGVQARAWWYSPGSGMATNFASYATSGSQSFTPPDTNDWVLVLDDASQGYGAPGSAAGAAPWVFAPPQSVAVAVGQSAQFSVGASGTAPLSYQWLFGGVAIAGATASSYSLGSVQSSNAGNYSVVVTNSYGSVTSGTAVLTVNGTVLAVKNTWQLAQQTYTSSASLAVSPSAGNLVVLGVSSSDGAITVVSNNLGMAATQVMGTNSGANYVSMWYIKNVGSGTGSVSVYGSGAAGITMIVYEVAGASATAPFTAGEAGGYAQTGANTLPTATISNGTANSILLAVGLSSSGDNPATFAVNGSGTVGTWTNYNGNYQQLNGSQDCDVTSMPYQLVTASGSQKLVWSIGSSSYQEADVIAAFHP